MNGQKCSLASDLKMEQPEHGHNRHLVVWNKITTASFCTFFFVSFPFFGGKGLEPISYSFLANTVGGAVRNLSARVALIPLVQGTLGWDDGLG